MHATNVVKCLEEPFMSSTRLHTWVGPAKVTLPGLYFQNFQLWNHLALNFTERLFLTFGMSAQLACALLWETWTSSRCIQLAALHCHYNWHLHVREWQRHQSVPCFWEIRQQRSRADPERFASTGSLMPASAPALMAHIMQQIIESYIAAVDPIWI